MSETLNIEDFRNSVSSAAPPDGLSSALQALWWDAKGDWDKAHKLAQKQSDAEGDWVHAYLHRVEGDLRNAAYWYRRVDRPARTDALRSEWADIAETLLRGAASQS